MGNTRQTTSRQYRLEQPNVPPALSLQEYTHPRGQPAPADSRWRRTADPRQTGSPAAGQSSRPPFWPRFSLDVARLLRRLGLLSLIRSGRGGSLGGELLRDGLGIVRLVPLTERRGVDLDDRALHEGVRPDEFVVRRVVDLKYSARYTVSELPQGCSKTRGYARHRSDES